MTESDGPEMRSLSPPTDPLLPQSVLTPYWLGVPEGLLPS